MVPFSSGSTCRAPTGPRRSYPQRKQYQFRFKATAQHAGAVELSVTDDGYAPSKPPKWSDPEEKPFPTVDSPKVVDGAYE